MKRLLTGLFCFMPCVVWASASGQPALELDQLCAVVVAFRDKVHADIDRIEQKLDFQILRLEALEKKVNLLHQSTAQRRSAQAVSSQQPKQESSLEIYRRERLAAAQAAGLTLRQYDFQQYY